MRSRLWLVFAVLIASLFVSQPAFANDYLNSFTKGLTQWQERPVDTRVDTDDEIESYGDNIELRAAPVTIYDYIRNVVTAFNRVIVGSDSVTLIQYIRYLIMGRTSSNNTPAAWSILPKALALVLIWWAVRKAVRMIFASFRKGKMNA